jgi:hypothetical protein
MGFNRALGEERWPRGFMSDIVRQDEVSTYSRVAKQLAGATLMLEVAATEARQRWSKRPGGGCRRGPDHERFAYCGCCFSAETLQELGIRLLVWMEPGTPSLRPKESNNMRYRLLAHRGRKNLACIMSVFEK